MAPMQQAANNYFIDIFTSQANCRNYDNVQPWNIEINENHAPEEDLFTNSILEMQEIHAIIKNMRSNAAP